MKKHVIVIGLIAMLLVLGCTDYLARQQADQQATDADGDGEETSDAEAGTATKTFEQVQTSGSTASLEPLNCTEIFSNDEMFTLLNVRGTLNNGILGTTRDIIVAGEAPLVECNYAATNAEKTRLNLPVGNTVLIMKAKCYYDNPDGTVSSNLVKQAFGVPRSELSNSFTPPAGEDFANKIFIFKQESLGQGHYFPFVVDETDLINQSFYDPKNGIYYGTASALPNCLVTITNFADTLHVSPDVVDSVARQLGRRLGELDAEARIQEISG